MNIHKDCKIELAASSGRTPNVINEPYLHIENGKGTLVATDGRRLVVIPVEVGEKDVAGYVSKAVLKAARHLGAKAQPATVELNGMATLPDGATLPRNGSADKKGQFPNWKQVIPREEYPHKIAFNAKMLYECAQAMGAETVCLHFRSEVEPIILTPNARCPVPSAKAVLMPMPYRIS